MEIVSIFNYTSKRIDGAQFFAENEFTSFLYTFIAEMRFNKEELKKIGGLIGDALLNARNKKK